MSIHGTIYIYIITIKMPRGNDMAVRLPGPKGFLTEDEKASAPKMTKKLMGRILSYIKPYWLQFLFVIVAIILSASIGLLPSILTGKIVDEALIGKDMRLLVKLLILAFGTLTASQAIEVLQSYVNAWISQRIIYDMKNQMYAHLQYMPHSFFTSEKQGDIITRMNSDIGGVSTVISGTLTSIVSNIATVITTLIALFAMNWKLAIVGIAVIPLLILPTKRVGKTRFQLMMKSQVKKDEMNQLVNETLSVSGSLLVKLFARERKEYEKFKSINDQAAKISVKEESSGKWFRMIMGMFTQIGPLLIYFIGGYFIITQTNSTLTVGTITATVALINRMYRPVQSLLNVHVDFTRSLALFLRIFDYFDRDVVIKSKRNAIKPDMTGDIVFQNVQFAYSKDKTILQDVSFTVPSGKMYAIVGASGSGKSTIVYLIPRLYDVGGGSVSISSVNVKDIDLTYLRENVGMVTQEAYLFNGSIAENLRVAKEDATVEELQEACKIANIHDFISAQPDGYDTQVGNRGLKLSGGEKQRISLARAVLKDPKILILDEATSALDSISENAIQDAMETLMAQRTNIVIAHRLTTILAADRILVVENGSIIEQGGHEQLLNNNGVYKKLYDTQFRKIIDREDK